MLALWKSHGVLPPLPPSPRRFVAVPVLAFALALLGAVCALTVPVFAASEQPPETSAEESESSPQQAATTFQGTVTVTATRSQRLVEETPGQIDVVDAEEIEELGYTGIEDLTLFMPGVYVEGDLTRLGVSGFNIRGIGGNRVLTQIDGIPTAEQFDFGPFSVTQYSLDVAALERLEVVRSAGSALYGSDALGGVVSLVTRSPRSYLGSRPQYFGFRAGYDGRGDESSGTLVYARGNQRWQGSVVYGHRDGHELDNQGEIGTEDASRTEPNPIDRRSDNLLGKLEFTPGDRSILGLTLELYDAQAETEVFSSRGPGSPFASAVLDSDGEDEQERRRLSLEQTLVWKSFAADSLVWNAYWQDAETSQRTVEIRDPAVGTALRDGSLAFEQDSLGLEVELFKSFDDDARRRLTYGALVRRDHWDGLRDRTETILATGEPVPTTLALPTKYFPESTVEEVGVFAQAELELFDGRLNVIPGLRYDRFDLDPNENDQIFLDGNPGQPVPEGLVDEAVSPKLGVVLALGTKVSAFAQYARGFRAPPMTAVNNGFTNQAGGYRTLPNADLEPETSDNFEVGLRGQFARGSFSITAFENRFDDFIDTVTVGFNPFLGLIEFQPQNIDEVETSGFEVGGDLRLAKAWRIRGAYSSVEGENITAGEPLESIAPPRLVTGLRYARPAGTWGVELIGTFVDSKDAEDLPAESTQFQAPSYQVADLSAWISLTSRLKLQVSGWNLTDETYWQWAYVRGQSEGSSALGRYTSPGRSFGIQLRASL